ncbi:MAG: PKD domain-containing protein [Flavobacteriales bacterium]|nr:hypothetical protein [Flavobacteriales bacterium]MCC6576073.1 PKD domain-containing protein [Flavobacteriales bacterium]NUQ15732.1 PKD domain-containing protein [Flavobacteriales bacterium]
MKHLGHTSRHRLLSTLAGLLGLALTVAQAQPCGGGVTVEVQATHTGANAWSFVATVLGAQAVYGQQWDAGDGLGPAGSGSTLAYYFTAPGTYLVCVSVDVLDQQGLPCTATGCVLVENSGQPPMVCDSAVVDFTGSFDSGTFAFTLETVLTAMVTSIAWDFGDGTTGSGMTVSHTFAGNGPYAVCMTAWFFDQVQQDSCPVQTCNWVYFGPDTIPCEQVLQPDFSHTVNGNAVAFVNTSVTSGALPALLWDFGDGSSSTDQAPIHVYAAPGQYDVCLTVTVDGALAPDTCVLSACLPVDLIPLVGLGEAGALVGGLAPNPCHTELQVRIEDGSGPFTAEVLDAQGRSWGSYRMDQRSGRVDVRDLAPGPYLLRIRDDRRTATLRFIRE